MEFDLEKYRISVVQDLVKQVEVLQDKTVVFPIAEHCVFDINDETFLDETSVRNKFNLPKKDEQVIYIFTLHNVNNEKLSKIEEEQPKKKAEYIGKSITGVTRSNLRAQMKKENSKVVLYIGTSNNLVKRLRQHVGHADAQSIYLMGWVSFFKKYSIELRLQYYNFGKFPSESLKLIEFYLSKEFKPLVGRNRKN